MKKIRQWTALMLTAVPAVPFAETYAITAAAEEKLSITCAAVKQFDSLIEYWGCEKIGMVNAYNVSDPESLKGTDFEEQAYRMGKSI